MIAGGVFTVMTTWRRGRAILTANRREREGSLREFVDEVRERDVPRVPGTAVFPHPGKDTTPLALRANVEHNHVLHRDVIIVSVVISNVPHVRREDAFAVDDLGYDDDHIQHVTVTFGFSDRPSIPRALRTAFEADLLGEECAEVEHASYFLSRGSIRRTAAPGTRALAQDAVHRARQERREPGGLLRPAHRPDGDDGQRRRPLRRAGAARDAVSPATWRGPTARSAIGIRPTGRRRWR